MLQARLEFLRGKSWFSTRTSPVHLRTYLQDIYVGEVSTGERQQDVRSVARTKVTTYSWANHAAVIVASRSLNWPRAPGLLTMTTTAFCTKLRVTSGDLTLSLSARICLVHAMPKRLVAPVSLADVDTRVKYENSSELA